MNIAINGFGRIGRNVLRAYLEYFDAFVGINIVAINDIADPKTLLHLLKFDSTHGRLPVEAWLDESGLCVQKGDKTLKMALLQEPNPSDLPWRGLGVELVLECTGQFREYDKAFLHCQAGARQVIVGAAPFDRVDACVVMGVNEGLLHWDLPVVSSVSCTTQALVPLLWALDNHFGVESAMMTEIHAVTADQSVLDQAHRDLRRGRASGHNIIPTTSSSIAATLQVLPHMAGKLSGHSVRVPTINVAAIDVTLVLAVPSELTAINAFLQAQSQGDLLGIMGYTDEPLVSSDFVHDRHSLVVDGLQTMAAGVQVKLFAWYDNEWGYANRLLEMCHHLHKKSKKSLQSRTFLV